MFADETLNGLMATALAHNFTLAQGVNRIERAQVFLRQAGAIRRPQVDLSAEIEREWTRLVRLDEPSTERRVSRVDRTATEDSDPDGQEQASGGGGGGSGDSESTGGDEEIDRDSWETTVSGGVSLSWEVDLWGRLRSLARAQREELSALVYDYDALRLFLSAQVADTYFEIVEQRLLLSLLEDQLRLARTFLELVELRFLHGDASSVDVLQQRSQAAEIESEVPAVRSRHGVLENRLDVLLGEPPDGNPRIEADPRPFPDTETLPAIGVPLELLRRRPDLQSLQRNVVALDHEIAAAIAARLPQVTLNGSFTYRDASDTGQLIGIGSGSFLQPLLDWGLRKATVDAARGS